MSHPPKPPAVALFITCLADMMRPAIGFAAARLIAQSGVEVVVPPQSCCGQPAYNAGDRASAVAIAKVTIAALEPFDCIVVPSGSCSGMIVHAYPDLFGEEPDWRARAEALGAKTEELLSYLDRRGLGALPQARWEKKAAYHDTCSGLREMKIREAPRRLLAGVPGLTLTDVPEGESCCGFGGTFAVKYPAISTELADSKLANAAKETPDAIIGGDLGCLLHLAGRARRLGQTLEFRHAAEVLAGMTDGPGIAGEP